MEDGEQIDVHAEAIGGGDALAAAPHRRKAIAASVKVGSNHLQPIANGGPHMTVTIDTTDPKESTFVFAECPDQKLFHSIRVRNSSSVWSFLKTYAYCKARKFDPNFGIVEQYRLGIETLKCFRHYNSHTAADLTIFIDKMKRVPIICYDAGMRYQLAFYFNGAWIESHRTFASVSIS